MVPTRAFGANPPRGTVEGLDFQNPGRVENELIDHVKGFEKYHAKPYFDRKGYTYGYGHFGVSKNAKPISEPEAEKLLGKDIAKKEKEVRALLHPEMGVHISKERMAKLTDVAYTAGSGKFKDSGLIRVANKGGSEAEFNKELDKWNKSNGETLAGLTDRRNTTKVKFSEGGPSALAYAPQPSIESTEGIQKINAQVHEPASARPKPIHNIQKKLARSRKREANLSRASGARHGGHGTEHGRRYHHSSQPGRYSGLYHATNHGQPHPSHSPYSGRRVNYSDLRAIGVTLDTAHPLRHSPQVSPARRTFHGPALMR